MSRALASRFRIELICLGTVLFAVLFPSSLSVVAAPVPTALQPWLQLLHGNATQRENAIDLIGTEWSSESALRAIEVLRFLQPSSERSRLISMLKMKTGFSEADDWGEWLRWQWKQPESDSPLNLVLKSELHAPIDSRFSKYFEEGQPHEIRYDEIVWGGVRQNGIPPLMNPAMLAADKASYLEDDHIVFGIVVNGVPYAYPKRILAWHEMFVATLEGVPLAGVYCTLCGAVVLYETGKDGKNYQLGTSGFLYRSNKLMFDEGTHSLWSTLEGKPVVGPLVSEGIELRRRNVATSSWGDWREQYPNTQVLSLETGHRRDYSEGTAYRDYFSSDRLMFPVPFDDQRLKNKAEILALLLGTQRKPVSISVEYLLRHRHYQGSFDGVSVLVLADKAGMLRAYHGSEVFEDLDWNESEYEIRAKGRRWKVEETHLQGENGERFERLPAHRAFWFGWHAAYPKTELVQ